jgi:hypothetical protein
MAVPLRDVLDKIKRDIAVEVIKRHAPEAIRRQSLENLERWKRQGVWGKPYEEWEKLLREGNDNDLLEAMLGVDERSNRMRQSMPYAGMLPRQVVERLNKQASP